MAGVGAAAERNPEMERGVEAEPENRREVQSLRWVPTSPCLVGGGFTGGRSNDAEYGGR